MELAWDKLIVALDLEEKEQIRRVVRALSPKGVKFKIGSIVFTKFGPEFVREFIDKGIDIFLDLKLYDIPNTMKLTSAVIAQMGCWAFTVHLKAGLEALKAVKQEVASTGKKPLILGVTVLTSSGLPMDETQQEIERLVRLARESRIEGVIASALDVKNIKSHAGDLCVVTPGIRNPEGESADQKRIATAKGAFANGADYIVVGRPIYQARDYLAVAEQILKK